MTGTYYDILGVTPDADPAALRRAFMGAAQQWHPDKAAEADRPAYEARFRRLSEAYETLSDPARRGRYDRELAFRRAPTTTAARPRTIVVEDADQFWQDLRWTVREPEASVRRDPQRVHVRTVKGGAGLAALGMLMLGALVAVLAVIVSFAVLLRGLLGLGRSLTGAKRW